MRIKKEVVIGGTRGFGIYVLTLGIGFLINGIGNFFTDADGFEIAGNIATNLYGLFSGIMGYRDYYELSGIHFFPFILGGLIWIIGGCYISDYRLKKEIPYRTIGRYSLMLGILIGGISIFLGFLLAFTVDSFAILLIFFAATIYIPLIVVGAGLLLYAKYKTAKG